MYEFRRDEGILGTKPKERSMEEHLSFGIAIIDKPIGPSSHEVAAFVRKILGLRVVGHTGTLDSNVSGVLVVLLENTRKLANFIPNSDKEYVCLMRINGKNDRQSLEAAFSNFRGRIYQRPPLESAVARRLRVRRVNSLEILEIDGQLVLFKCSCEAGTYIRKIVSDIGELMCARTEMVELRRTRAGDFSEKDAISLQALTDYHWIWKEGKDESILRKAIRPIESVHFKRMVVCDFAAKSLRSGIKPKIGDLESVDEGIFASDNVGIYSLKGELLAVGEAVHPSKGLQTLHSEGKELEVAAKIIRVVHPQ